MMNIQKMMQQAKQMQDKMQVMQEKMAQTEVQGQAGAGLVKITMTCKGMVRRVEIDPSILVASEKEITEDLIKAALNDAREKGDQAMTRETEKMMGEMGLPAGVQLPF